MYEPSAIAGLVVTAVLTAGLYALMSYGLALVYGVMKIINLAHAGTMMLGAFIVLTLNRAFHLDPILGAVVSAGVFFLLGMALYRLAVRRVVNAPPIASLLLLFGVWLCAQNAAYLIWGSEDQSIVTVYTFSTVDVGDIKIAVSRLIPFGVSLVALGGLTWFMRATDLGKAIRAVSQNAMSARLVGVWRRLADAAVLVQSRLRWHVPAEELRDHRARWTREPARGCTGGNGAGR